MIVSYLSFRFVHGEGYEERPIVEVVVLLGLAGVLYLVVANRALSFAPPLRTVVVVSILARIILVVSTPIQEDDIYRYVWDGRVRAEGVNPYLYSPDNVEDIDVIPDDPRADVDIHKLNRLVNRSESVATVFSRVNNREYATIYPPIAQAVFCGVALFVPEDWSALNQVIGLKAVLCLFDVGTLLALIRLLQVTRQPPGLVVLYGWCPLVLKEVANSGHMDSIPTFFLVSAVVVLLEYRSLVCGVFLGLAVGAKFYALLLLPLVCRRLGWKKASVVVGVCLLLMVAASVAVGNGAERYLATLLEFSLLWENNDFVFTWLQAVGDRLFSGCNFTIELFTAQTERTLGFLFAASLVGLIVLAISLLVARGVRQAAPAEVARRAFIPFAALFLLGPVGFPWYFLWCMPFLPFVRLRSWWVLPCLLPLYYLRFWWDYHYEDGFAGFETGVDFFDYVVTGVEFGLFFVLAASESVYRGGRRRGRISN